MNEDARRTPGNRCAICGQPDDLLRQLDYAHGTCSQACARTVAIVQALDRNTEALLPRKSDREPYDGTVYGVPETGITLSVSTVH